mmetsp:Transcript_8141/g.9483  ORF Transcript_8141/g.9483 Transcript_8141/m.9483 type:complete len:260 (+) Transcript_8141:73-852(+)|eukprot:CAMPEP_0204648908 /NCGR_PEP_ID=MMETSP0718-20130828/8676_1 /ASSEMBLY_ACC=CAM_ASM_000674 /TAXON_ID=230516 /ORGANISM="Chaetoceros curvisetus" /LENGTH=259 /DNA_ID=CAMNT_0051671857 /DNA_START=26 /DNA_END=805 /DNA_ORIENTATION=+
MIHPNTETTPSIDPMDTKWQANPQCKPDKGSEWNHTMEEDGWIHAHNSLRGEIQDIGLSLTSISEKFPGNTPGWAIKAIQAIWSGHEVHVHSHHQNEDDIMNPMLKERINLPDRLETDHVGIVNLIQNVTDAVNALEQGSGLEAVMTAFNAYREDLLPHLLEEENIALPLVFSFFTPKEIGAAVRKIMMKGNRIEMGSFVHYMTEDHFRHSFMKQEGIPFFVWYLAFKSHHQYFIKHMKDHFDALQSGTPPITKGCFAA